MEAEEPLPEGAVENYLASRERKLRLSDAMFQALEETADGQFRVLIGIDDSSEEDSIQKTRSPISGRSCAKGTPCSPVWTTWPLRR